MVEVSITEFLIDASSYALERFYSSSESEQEGKAMHDAFFDRLSWIQDRIEEMYPLKVVVRKGAPRREIEQKALDKICKAFNEDPDDYEVCICDLACPWSFYDFLSVNKLP